MRTSKRMQGGCQLAARSWKRISIALSFDRGSPHRRQNVINFIVRAQNLAVSFSHISTAEKSSCASVSTMDKDTRLAQLIPALQAVVPSLSPDRHKGQAGKIAVIGGCREYTGAPFFAAFSALKIGADLSHVFCTEGAGTVIKSYSPELIVHPILRESHDTNSEEKSREDLTRKVVEDVGKWIQRFNCIVIGPGLGRDSLLLESVSEIIRIARESNIALVIDGDGLSLVTEKPDLVRGYSLTVLTPNVNEHKRLVTKMIEQEGNLQEDMPEDLPGQLQSLAKWFIGVVQYAEVEANSNDVEITEGILSRQTSFRFKIWSNELGCPFLPAKYTQAILSLKSSLQNSHPFRMGGVTIVQKGKVDYISDGQTVHGSDYFGSPRRCGGQGDVLSGSTAVFVSWAQQYFINEKNKAAKQAVQDRVSNNPAVIGALAGSILLRKAAADAFAKHKRSTLTVDIIEALPESMEKLFPISI